MHVISLPFTPRRTAARMQPLARMPVPFMMALLLALVTLAALAGLSAPARATKMLADTDLAGETYRSFELVAPVPDFCRKVCEKDEGCRAWTFSWPGKKGKRAQCFLKRSVSERKQDTCCISGYKKRGAVVSFRDLARRWLGGDDDEKAAGKDGTAVDGGKSAGRTANAPVISPAPAGNANRGDAATPSPAATDANRVDASRGDAEAAAMRAAEREARLARKRTFCRQYARAARAANRRARALGCGFRGGLWGASFNGYFNWCMKNPRQAADRNTQRRAAALQRCASAALNRPAPRMDDRYPPPEFGVPPVYRRPPPPAYDAPPPAARALQRRAPWLYSWLKRSGPGPRATPWRPSVSGKCPLVRACSCPQGNTCRVYDAGAIAVSWPLGCDGPPAYMVCRVRRR